MHSLQVRATEQEQAVAALEQFFPGVVIGRSRGPDFHFELDAYDNGHGLAMVEASIGGRDMTSQVEDTAGVMVSIAHAMDGPMIDAGTTVDDALPYATRSGLRTAYSRADFLTLSLDDKVLDSYRSLSGIASRQPFRFTDVHPRTPEHAASWRFLADTVRRAMHEGLADNPVLGAALTEMMAAAIVECFPTTWTTDHEAPLGHPTSAVRRAIAFIDEHAHEPITVTRIAEAARLSVRGLQSAFQAQVGVSPMAHLRRVRLDSARTALLAADPTDGATVAAVATARGFTHLARFAAAYRAEYGENPSDTLHR